MKILVIEDEELAVEKLTHMLEAMDFPYELAGKTGSIASSVEWLKQHPAPDLILMDIELSDGQSFEIFHQVEVSSPVIFITSYDEFALRAFKVNSIDYLLKPIEEDDLRQALSKFRKLAAPPATGLQGIDVKGLITELKNQLREKGSRNRFLVRQGQQLVSVEINEIAYFFADGRLCYFMTWDKRKFVVDYPLEDLEAMVDTDAFFRVNRAFLVHVKSIQQIHHFFNGKLKLTLKPDLPKAEVLVSRERATEFKKWMGK